MNARFSRGGFTLLEVMLALSILAMMGVMIFGGFTALVDSTTRTEQALDRLHVSETVLDQMDLALRGAVFFEQDARRTRFVHEADSGSPPRDRLSWVTRSPPFLPPSQMNRGGLYRVELEIGEVDGETGLAQRVYSSLLDEGSPEADETEWVLISPRVRGLSLRIFDINEGDWTDVWERDNQLPVTLALRLYVETEAGSDALRTLTRRIDIPVGKRSRDTRRGGRRAAEAPP